MLAMIDAHLARGGQLIMVGDKHQHIHGWAGALDAIDTVAENHNEYSAVFPHCWSYRLARTLPNR